MPDFANLRDVTPAVWSFDYFSDYFTKKVAARPPELEQAWVISTPGGLLASILHFLVSSMREPWLFCHSRA